MTQEGARTFPGACTLRAGGATLVAAEGVCERLFQRHGGWRDPASRDRYVADSFEHRLEVTRAMLRNVCGVSECEGGGGSC